MDVLDWVFLFLTICVSIETHLHLLGHPNSVVFDEVNYGPFTHYYHNGTYFFDSHPPLGKELLYLGSRLSGYRYKENYTAIGRSLNLSQIRRLRFWPAITGSLCAPLMFGAFRFLGVSTWWSLAFGLFVATDQALIAQSRHVLIDPYLTMFASLAIFLTALIARSIKGDLMYWLVIIAVGIASGCAVSVKFTGGSVGLTLVFVLLIRVSPIGIAFLSGLLAGICGLLVLLMSFKIHFALLHEWGDGCTYHAPSFCSELQAGELIWPEATVELIPMMLAATFDIPELHNYASPWWSWPFMLGLGSYLWTDVNSQSQIWAIGSPIVWWGGTMGMYVWIVIAIGSRQLWGTSWLVFGWAVSYLPFGLLHRALWKHHYLIPLLYSLGAAAVAANTIAPKARVVPIIFIIGAFACWWVYYPITYGTPIPLHELKKRMLPCWTY